MFCRAFHKVNEKRGLSFIKAGHEKGRIREQYLERCFPRHGDTEEMREKGGPVVVSKGKGERCNDPEEQMTADKMRDERRGDERRECLPASCCRSIDNCFSFVHQTSDSRYRARAHHTIPGEREDSSHPSSKHRRPSSSLGRISGIRGSWSCRSSPLLATMSVLTEMNLYVTLSYVVYSSP